MNVWLPATGQHIQGGRNTLKTCVFRRPPRAQTIHHCWFPSSGFFTSTITIKIYDSHIETI